MEEFTTIGQVVRSADLPTPARDTALWCLEQLPRLCQEFQKTYESRYWDEILRREQGIMAELSDGAPEVTAAVLDGLRTVHERLGLPQFVIKVPAVARTAKARAAKSSKPKVKK